MMSVSPNAEAFNTLAKNRNTVNSKDIIYLNDNLLSTISRTGKIIKPTGTRVQVIIASEVQTRNFLSAIVANKMDKTGNAIL
jgi:hypothetical protein